MDKEIEKKKIAKKSRSEEVKIRENKYNIIWVAPRQLKLVIILVILILSLYFSLILASLGGLKYGENTEISTLFSIFGGLVMGLYSSVVKTKDKKENKQENDGNIDLDDNMNYFVVIFGLIIGISMLITGCVLFFPNFNQNTILRSFHHLYWFLGFEIIGIVVGPLISQ